jgi:hypothetical protein
MRRPGYSLARRVSAVVLMIVLAASVSARPRDERPIREPRDKREVVVKIIRWIKSLGHGLTTPTPTP